MSVSRDWEWNTRHQSAGMSESLRNRWACPPVTPGVAAVVRGVPAEWPATWGAGGGLKLGPTAQPAASKAVQPAMQRSLRHAFEGELITDQPEWVCRAGRGRAAADQGAHSMTQSEVSRNGPQTSSACNHQAPEASEVAFS